MLAAPQRIFEIRPSKIILAFFVFAQLIACVSVLYLVFHDIHYLIFAFIYIIMNFFYIKKWAHEYKTNAIVRLRFLDNMTAKPLFWEITFKSGVTQKVQLLRYYRTAFLIILSYKIRPHHSRLSGQCSSLVIAPDTVSHADYRHIARLLWSG